MFLARRSVAPARQQLLRRQQPRRFDSHAAHHAAPANESFGPSFYVAVTTFATGYVLYRIHKASQESGSETWLSSLIRKWTPLEKVFEERNAIRTAAMEKAAVDRHLFASAPGKEYIDLKMPELFNAGSPYNVPPGSQADLSAVAAYYHQKNKEIEEQRVARMKDGKVVSIYD
ncbi:hypothetical protein VTN96DRAFT_4786 [Rasamsonia emersonii]|uniref:NADH:ubiquinone reductase (H(+)-translocating) n=1 Tax=Rasamsonia emersonii (strain ATCC 16479 / CBS 393.64 / IMI 116815) TaxID=1408163 RepID=A0A0F4YHW1_RASE3|nr:NADH:ubiquinone reductase (H(+)-translocating) [Rasamsonia emersonii CBS 393.64]KKA17685.1 NADH:ubiquinone reductase (H(+)-translocating) [Rasamsonia emersonii CBS 393.64]